MREFSLTVTNDLGTFDFNAETLEALKEYLIFSFPLVNADLSKAASSDVGLDYCEHIKSILPKLRVLKSVLHHEI